MFDSPVWVYSVSVKISDCTFSLNAFFSASVKISYFSKKESINFRILLLNQGSFTLVEVALNKTSIHRWERTSCQSEISALLLLSSSSFS